MKKFVSLLVAVALITMLSPMSAFAHGHGGATRVSYALCSVENCNITHSHCHGDTWYSGHSIGDGHDYHAVCSVSGCTLNTTHDHDGVTCFPHNQGDGDRRHISGHRGGGRHH